MCTMYFELRYLLKAFDITQMKNGNPIWYDAILFQDTISIVNISHPFQCVEAHSGFKSIAKNISAVYPPWDVEHI